MANFVSPHAQVLQLTRSDGAKQLQTIENNNYIAVCIQSMYDDLTSVGVGCTTELNEN
jgi:hypothetical protein